MGFLADQYATAVHETAKSIDWANVEKAVQALVRVRANGGRLFILGLGGSAGNASHAANDFRKLAHLECYAPTDNASEMTARINDEGWGSFFIGWLRVSRLSENDAVLVLSVGGGDVKRGVSIELVEALRLAQQVKATILAIVGRDGGFAGTVADHLMLIPTVDSGLVTPIAEAYQAVIWHGMVTHPDLAAESAHWEALGAS